MYNYKILLYSYKNILTLLFYSRLHYCNSLICFQPSISITKFDRIIRASTIVVYRLTFNLSYSDYTAYVSPLLYSLKWLTFKNRYLFKFNASL